MWPCSVGDRACFVKCPPWRCHTQRAHHGCVDSPQMGTCSPWVVMTAHRTWPPWRSMSPRCETHPNHTCSSSCEPLLFSFSFFFFQLLVFLIEVSQEPLEVLTQRVSSQDHTPVLLTPALEQGLRCGGGGRLVTALPEPSPAGERMDAGGLHAEPAQLSRSGSAGGGPVRGRRQ